jgi:hypothetical protein
MISTPKREDAMRRPILVVLIAIAGMLAIWSLTTSAQVIDSSPCEQSCYEQKSICVSACGTQTNPVECEAQCHDEVVDCLEECR